MLLYNKWWAWILKTIGFKNVTDGRKINVFVVVLWEKKSNTEIIYVVERGSVRKLYFYAKILIVDHARFYVDEVDPVKLESSSLFATGVNLYLTEDWESRLFVFLPKVLIVEIAVPLKMRKQIT